MSDVAADPICQSPRGVGGTVLGFGGDGEDRKTETRLWSEVSHLSFLSRSIWPDVRSAGIVFGVEGRDARVPPSARPLRRNAPKVQCV